MSPRVGVRLFDQASHSFSCCSTTAISSSIDKASAIATPGSLPTGTGSVARIGVTDNFVVTVRWDDDLSGSTGTTCQRVPPDPNIAVTPADLECYQLTIGF